MTMDDPRLFRLDVDLTGPDRPAALARMAAEMEALGLPPFMIVPSVRAGRAAPPLETSVNILFRTPAEAEHWRRALERIRERNSP